MPTFRTLIATLALLSSTAFADARLPKIFGDNMVLQRGKPIAVWGWADAGEKVTVKLGDKEASATADEKGNWSLKLPVFEAGAPLELTITAKNTITFKNVLIGEVWICSGQSNMEMWTGGVTNAQAEVAAANFPKIRLFTVQKSIQVVPQKDCNGTWQECSPATVNGFSAVGYFFGRKLHKDLDVPIGLISSNWGGTVCEAWASGEALKTHPDFKAPVKALEKMTANFETITKEYNEKIGAYEKAAAEGLKAIETAGCTTLAYDDSKWKTMEGLPSIWEGRSLDNFDGIVWFRKTVEIPEAWAGKELALGLGNIDDADTTYVNGVKVGETASYNTPRNYKVPATAVKAGKLVVAVRVLDTGGGGGLYGPAEQMKISAEGQPPIALTGAWKFSLGELPNGLPPRPAKPPIGNDPNYSSVLYNGMIAPLVPYTIQGAIWYQGESNAGRGRQYRTLFPLMIQDWRKQWNDELSFYFVQLANFMAPRTEPGESSWAELREAQNLTLALPKTGQAVIIDIGEANDIHPHNKQDVGLRLALAAEAVTFGKKIVFSGPKFRDMKVEGASARLSFDHVGGGLEAKGGGALKYFSIAGEDKKFVWAEAKIDGETIVVSSPAVAKPVAVRYAWADNPEGCNLYNKEGLPATPFRTDSQ